MQNFNLDLIIFSVFLGLNLILGLRAGRKVKTLKHYAIGWKNFATPTLTATIIATWLHGGLFFYLLSNIYQTGLHFIISALGLSLCLLLIGKILSIRMGEFLHNISVAEAMGDLYGKLIRIITGISGIFVGIGSIAVQLQVTKKMLNIMFDLDSNFIIILAAFIIISYSALGGIRAVTITDVFQFITFSIFIPILTLIIWNHIKSPSKVIDTIIENPLFNVQNTVGYNLNFFSTIALLFYFTLPSLKPCIFQRISMAKNTTQVKKSFTYAAGITFFITILITIFSVLLISDNPNLEPNKLINHIINTYAYPGLKGLIAIGIIAMAMSTADSELNASAVIGINDILKPLKKNYIPSISHIRIFSVLLGIIALVLALHTQNLLQIMLLSASFYMPVVTIPLVFAIFGFRTTKKSVLIGMSAGISTVIIWTIFFSYTGITSVIPGMIGNIIFFIGSHYLLKQSGGWVGIKEKQPLIAAKIARRRFWQSVYKNITQPKPYTYLKKNLPSREIFYTLFGIYMLGATYGSFFIIPEDIRMQYNTLYNHIFHSVIITASAFITYPAWPLTFKGKKFIAFAWPIALFYILFVIGGVLLIMSGFHEAQMFIFLLNIVLIALLLEWPLWMGMLILGWLLSKAIFLIYIGDIPQVIIPAQSQFKFLYGLSLFSIFIIALIRFRQAKKGVEAENLALMFKNQNMSKALLKSYQEGYKFARKFQEAGAHKLHEIALLSKNILSSVKKKNLDNKIIVEMQTLDEKITPLAYHLDQLENRVLKYLKLDITKINIHTLIQQVEEQIKKQNLSKNIQWKCTITQKNIVCDVEKIVNLITHTIVFIQNVHPSKSITIDIKNTQLGYDLHCVQKNYIKKIPAFAIIITIAEKIPLIQDIYKSSKKNLVEIVKTDALLLMNNHRIIQAHYGYEQLEIKKEYQMTQFYVIPCDITTLRPKELDLMDLSQDPPIAMDYYVEIAEKKFLAQIKKTPHINIEKITKAIEIMKRYHGSTKRNSGEPFYTHPLAVAEIVSSLKTEEDTIIAALLHDTVEDTPLSLEQITVLFNRNVARLVEGVTHLSYEKDPDLYLIKLSPQENIQKLLAIGDSHIFAIKLADRLHNMQTIKCQSIRSQKRKAEETLLFFVPIARLLSFDSLSKKLQDLSFNVLKQKN